MISDVKPNGNFSFIAGSLNYKAKRSQCIQKTRVRFKKNSTQSYLKVESEESAVVTINFRFRSR